MQLLTILYIITAVWLAVYAFNSWYLTLLFLKNQKRSRTVRPRSLTEADYPLVTVQLPIYNEAHVVSRLIDTVVKLDYPAGKLQIQVLDDSTDQTTEIARQKIWYYQNLGINIELVRRPERVGFKAGALDYGLKQASGELIAIFDSDFVPNPDFLHQTVPYLVESPDLAFVQTRWGHLNRDYSVLTASQALALDGHFTVEQIARNQSRFLMNFNGTGGVWRRTSIDQSGGWQHDTLCEDLDLSYRAQFHGWQALYLPHVVSPAELPPQLAAFKRQQFRWAKGSIQCVKKLGWQIVTTPDFSWLAKAQAFLFATGYLIHPLIVILAIVTPILTLTGALETISFPMVYLSPGCFGPPLLFLAGQFVLNRHRWFRNILALPILVLLGAGIALSNTKAVVEALLGVGSSFRRTPKFNVAHRRDRWQNSSYRLPLNGLIVGEILLSLYSLITGVWAIYAGYPAPAFFILLYGFSFGYISLLGLWEVRYDLWGWVLRQFALNREAPSQSQSQSS